VSELCYDRRSVGQSVLVSSTHQGLTTRFLLLSDNCGFVDVGGPYSDERSGLSFTMYNVQYIKFYMLSCVSHSLTYSNLIYHTHTHTHTQTTTYSYSLSHSLTHTVTVTHTHTQSLSHTLTHSHTLTRTHSLSQPQSHTPNPNC
jgi:hypothetical protein